MTTQNIAAHTVYDKTESKFLPQQFAEGVEVVDFWYTVYCGGADVLQRLSQKVCEKLVSAGHQIESKDVSFVKSVLLGKARPFYVVSRNVARATVNMSMLGNQEHVYVSLRLLFKGNISYWKRLILMTLMAFLAIPSALLGFWPIWALLGTEKQGYNQWGYATGTTVNWENALIAFLVAVLIGAAINSFILSLWCLWRYGDSRALEREDLDELYRDDLAALGTEIMLAVTSAADELDLEQLRVEGEALPVFAANTQTNRTKRKPRM